MILPLLALTVFVHATAGSDAGDGSAAHPYRTLEKARAAVRALRAAGKAPREGVTVELTGAFDRAGQTLRLDARDGGAAAAPVVWRASAAGATISGAYRLAPSDFAPVGDPAVRARLKEGVRDRVRVADLARKGLGEMKPLPDRFGNWSAVGLELYAGGEAMPVARHPDSGWLEITNVIDRGVVPVDPKKGEWECGVRGGTFEYAGDEPARWDVSKGVFMHGYWCWDWAAETLKVAEIDPVRRTVRSAGIHYYGIGKDVSWQGKRRYYFYNFLEALDAPGEWYVDRAGRKLYYLPPAGAEDGVRLVSGKNPLVVASRVENLVFEGLRFDCAPKVLEAAGCTNVVLRGLNVTRVSGDAIGIRGGASCTVEGCAIAEIGRTALTVEGGSRRWLAKCNHRVTRNRIERCGRRGHSGKCLAFGGCGVTVDRNLFREVPYIAVSYGGNEHLFANNEIACAMLEAADGGGVYTGRDWGSQGNVVRGNYFHHFGRAGIDYLRAQGRKARYEESKGNHQVMGLYLDDCDSGELVTGNVFEKAGMALFVGGGRWNTLSNNLVVGSLSAIHQDTRGLSRAKPGSGRKDGWDLLAKLEEQHFREFPWRERYPHLLNVMEDEPHMPLHDVFAGTVSIGNASFLRANGKRIDEAIARTEVGGNVHVGARTREDAKFFPTNAPARVAFVQDAALEDAAARMSALELMKTDAFRRRFPDFPVLDRSEVGLPGAR